MKTWIIHVVEQIRAAAWTKPTVYVLLALALSEYTLWLDLTETGRVFESSGIFKLTSPEGVRGLLGTIATSMLTITGVSFSSIMVVMTLASQQFGPRLLRNFLKDPVSQRTLGLLMGTFVFCLSVMKDVKSAGSSPFVPHLSTFAGLILALVALGSFIYFIQHIVNKTPPASTTPSPRWTASTISGPGCNPPFRDPSRCPASGMTRARSASACNRPATGAWSRPP